MEEIELKNLFRILLKRWWVIFLLTIFTSALGVVYTIFIVKPLYQSDVSIYIWKSSKPESVSIMYNDVLLNDRLVNDYRELVKSRLIADEVIREMNLKDINYEQLAAKLNVTSKKDTRLIFITASDFSPELARNLADKVAEVFQKKSVEFMKVENIQIIDRAIIPKVPVKPSKILNISISFLVGFLFGIVTVLIMEYFDDTIKTPEDAEKQLGLPVICTIPIFPE